MNDMRPVPAIGTVVVVRPPVGSPVGTRVEPAAVEVIIGEPVVRRPVPDWVVVVPPAELALDVHSEFLVAGAFQHDCFVGRADSRADELDGQLLHSGSRGRAGCRACAARNSEDENCQDDDGEKR